MMIKVPSKRKFSSSLEDFVIDNQEKNMPLTPPVNLRAPKFDGCFEIAKIENEKRSMRRE